MDNAAITGQYRTRLGGFRIPYTAAERVFVCLRTDEASSSRDTKSGDTTAATNGTADQEEEAGWAQVGPKNKAVITRAVSLKH